MTSRITADGILAASRALPAAIRDTPLLDSEGLAHRLGARILLKVETLGPVRSFKARGAEWLVERLLTTGARPDSMVCASAGNFGQGMAWAARRRGLPVTVFAAESANPLKVARMRELGATVTLAGRDFDAAKDAARAHAAATGMRFVEDGREPAIAEGAGSIAVELLRQHAAPDAVLVPLGNGALLAGIGRWLRAEAPATRIIAVCAAGAPAMARSIAEGRVVETASVDTIADGIGVRVPVPEALEDLRGVIDEVVLVDDDAIRAAMRMVWQVHGLAVEPAGAAGLAAVVAAPARWAGQVVATPLCGGNVTDAQARDWLLD